MQVSEFHLRALLKFFQASSNGLDVDGVYGPETAAQLDAYIRDNLPGNKSSGPMQDAFESAMEDVGKCEDPMGSNDGAYVEGMRDEVNLPRLGGGEWCGVFGSVHMTRQGTLAVSRGARDLVKQVATLGREVTPSQLHPGFYGVALRKRMHGHHVQFFRVFRNFTGATIIQHVGGNERNKVRSAHHKPEDFLRGVIMIATVD